MKPEVDLSQLAIDRGGNASAVAPRGHVLTHYVVPGAVILGLLGLVTWAGWDLMFPPRPVRVVPVLATQAEFQAEGTPLFKAAGWVEPRPTPVRVAALAPGVVEQLLVVEDQHVKVGEPIAELVKDDARLTCQGAEADLKLREAELQAAQAGLAAAKTRFEQPVHLEEGLAEAEAELAAVETQLVNLPFEVRRAEADQAFAKSSYEGKSSAGGAVTGRLVEEAFSQLQSATALVDELKGRADSLEKQKDALARRRDSLEKKLELRVDESQAKVEAEAKVAVAQARVQQAEIALEEARLQLQRMTVRSTVDGRVLHLVARPGSRLMSGRGTDDMNDGSTVVTLYRPDSLQVRVDVRFEDLPRIQLGQRVTIGSPAVSSNLAGEVLFLSSEADIQKNTLQVKVAITDPPSVLKPEMLVEVTFLASEPQQQDASPSDRLRLLIPEELVQRQDGGAFVWVADLSAGVAIHAPIEVGLGGRDGLIEVTGGLNPASRLIASGLDGLREGQRIRVLGEANETATAVLNHK